MAESKRPAWGAGPPANTPSSTTPSSRSVAQPPALSPALGIPIEAVAPLEIKSASDLIREYVSGGGYSWYGQMVRALPPAIDDVTADFGDDLYERMGLDPQISACMSILKAAILEDGLHLMPAIDDADDPDYDLAVEILEEAEAMLDNLIDPLDDALWDMLSCIAMGNRVAEQKFGYAAAEKDGRKILNLEAIKVKPRRATAFVIDPYLNVVGLLGRPPGFPSPFLASWLIDPKAPPPNLLPRNRFVILTYRPKDGDPRGVSLLRPAYEAWWRKRQIIPEWLKYITQFAGPSIWGTVPEKATPQPQLDANGVPIPGAPMLTPETVLFNALQQLRNGTAGAFPFGTTINSLGSTNSSSLGSPFAQAIAAANLEITKVILTQNLATEEGEHMARAAATVHQDVLDTLIRQGKRSVVRVLGRDVLRPWISYNWGDKARKLMPKSSLGVTEEQNRGPLMTAIAALKTSGFLAPSQMQAIDEMLGLPQRTAEEAEPPVVIAPPPAPAPSAAPGQSNQAGDPTQQSDSEGTSKSPDGASPPSGKAKTSPANSGGDAPSSPETPKAGASSPAKGVVSTSRISVRPHDRGRPVRRAVAKFDDGGHWITIDGQHVLIGKGGAILQGGSHLGGGAAKAGPPTDGSAAAGGAPVAGLKALNTVPITNGSSTGDGSLQNPIACGNNLEQALAEIAAGHHVRLNQPDQVATLIDKMGTMVNDAKAKGLKAPTYDLGLVTVPGTNLFTAESKGIPRAQMPQLSGTPTPGSPGSKLGEGHVDLGPSFAAALQARGVSVTNETVLASHLRATQFDLSGGKVSAMVSAMNAGKISEESIAVTRDNYIVDGHHRWAAKVAIDLADNHVGDVTMPVRRINMDIGAAIDFANAYSKAMGIPQAAVFRRLMEALFTASGVQADGGPGRQVAPEYQVTPEQVAPEQVAPERQAIVRQTVKVRGEPLARVDGVNYSALDRWMMGEVWAAGVPEEYARLLRAPVVRPHDPHPSAEK